MKERKGKGSRQTMTLDHRTILELSGIEGVGHVPLLKWLWIGRGLNGRVWAGGLQRPENEFTEQGASSSAGGGRR